MTPAFTLNYGLRFDHFTAYTQRESGESALERRLADRAADDAARGLFALSVAAAVRTRRREGHRAVPEHDRRRRRPRARTPRCRRRPITTTSASQQKVNREFTVGLDTYYKQSVNLIDEGQFGAPIILTPFNYRYGKQYGAEFTANYTANGFTRLPESRGAKRQGQADRLGAVQFRAGGSRLHRQQLHPPRSRAAEDRLRRRVLSLARHAVQRGLPAGLGPARGSGAAARRDDGLWRHRHSERRAPAVLHARSTPVSRTCSRSRAPGR